MLTTLGCKDNKPQVQDTASAEVTQKQPLSDEALLDSVQKQTLKYFWDYAEPNSGMGRERFHPDGNYPQDDAHVVTTGGSGFGLMGIVAGIDRGFIPRDSAVARLGHIADFWRKPQDFMAPGHTGLMVKPAMYRPLAKRITAATLLKHLFWHNPLL